MRFAPTVLRRGLRVVAPGQPRSQRIHDLVELLPNARADAAEGRTAAAALRVADVRGLAVISDQRLNPVADSASHRLAWLIRLAIRDGWKVSFHSTRRRQWFLVDRDLQLHATAQPPPASVAWVVRPEAAAVTMPALASLRPSLRVVYDSMDLHYLRLQRESHITNSRGLALQARLMKELERQVSSRADVAVAITDLEAPLLRKLAGRADVVVLPNVHEPTNGDPPPLSARAGLLFVGNFTHTPNLDALQVLAREVMPRLWEHRPELSLAVAGRGLESLELDPRIQQLGFVENLDALVDRSCALVAPLRFGAGLKGKIGYALARGLPAVTTPIGVEGFIEPTGMRVLHDGDWQAFAYKTLELIGNAELWSRSSAAGFELTRCHYSPQVILSTLRQILNPSPIAVEGDATLNDQRIGGQGWLEDTEETGLSDGTRP